MAHGGTRSRELSREADGGRSIALDLAPYESRVVVFSKDRPAPLRAPSAAPPAAMDISAGWKVTFAGSPQPVAMDRLVSWTELDAEKYFSGQATYEKTVTLDAAFVTSGRAVRIDFGEGTPVTPPERRAAAACAPCSKARCAKLRWLP